MAVLPNGNMGQYYFGKRIHEKEDYSYFWRWSPVPWLLMFLREREHYPLSM